MKPITKEESDALRFEKRKNRDLKRHLTALTTTTLVFLERLDQVMREPSAPDRGAKIAKLSNALDFANDTARFNGLHISFRDDDKKAALQKASRVAADQFAEVLREWWAFDDHQQHTHSWHTREDFIEDKLPELLASVGAVGRKP